MDKVVDNGPAPLVVNIENSTVENTYYRTTLWTGKNLQTTLMSINPGEDIGLEVHPDHDQFLRVEQGQAMVQMGPSKDQLQDQQAGPSDAIIVPAGTWHNITCKSGEALKVYSIYAPVQHPHGTVHVTKDEAEKAEAGE
jgi:mannose-6-phosphate isomerase-like protein (cupin superfamily)